MCKATTIAAILILGLISGGFASMVIVDPGAPDLIAIGSDGIRPGETAIIPIAIINDENVACLLVPIVYNDAVFQYDSCVFHGTINQWDDISALLRGQNSMVTIIGYADLGGESNPYLNSNGNPLVIASLYFTPLPGAPLGSYPLTIGLDPYAGPIDLCDSNGNDWMPTSQNGEIQIVDEQGFADTISIGSDTAIAGQNMTIPIFIRNDEAITSINLPIVFDNDVMNLIGWQVYDDLAGWDVISVGQRPGEGVVCISGIADTGGFPNESLNTEWQSSVMAELYFSTNSVANPASYGIQITGDSGYGEPQIGDAYEYYWCPVLNSGFAQITAPAYPDMEFLHLWGYGLCRTPSDHRQYSCRVVNWGDAIANNVSLNIAFPSVFTYDGSNPEASITDNSMVWDLGDLAIGASATVYWWVDIPLGLENDTVITIADIACENQETNIVNNHREFVEIVGFSYDPNDKISDPAGYGTSHFIDKDERLIYAIFFENSDSATLPAEDIFIIDTLDEKLDWASLQFGPLSHDDPCSLWFNESSGVLGCQCNDIMLLPNDSTHRGEGFISYSIKPKWNVVTGDIITNRAYIVFDQNPAIPAPHENSLVNIIDASAPISRATIPYDSIFETSFSVFWDGNDESGSGISCFDIYFATDNGPFLLWLSKTGNFNSTFIGDPGHTYSFYSIAYDYLNHTEGAPNAADATIIILDFISGDTNGDRSVMPSDVTYLVRYLKGIGSAPYPFRSADTNGDCVVLGSDVTYLVRYLKGIGPAPVRGVCP
jgi:hypothetical protein